MFTLFQYLNQVKNDTTLFAIHDNITREQLVKYTIQLSELLQDKHIQKAGIWCEDTAWASCILLACADAGVDVYFPPNRLPENEQWLQNTCDILLTDSIQEYEPLPYIRLPEDLPNTPNNLLNTCHSTHNIQLFLKTSASSGQAKIIRKTWQNMADEAVALSTIFTNYPEKTLVLGSVSTQHLYGLTFRLVLSLCLGWVIDRTRYHYPETLTNASHYENTPYLWVVSPALLHRLHETNWWLKPYHSKLGIISSGGILAQHTTQFLREEQHCFLCEIYGSTETGVIAYRQNTPYWQWLDNIDWGISSNDTLWVKSTWVNEKQQTADSIIPHDNGFELLGRQDRIIKLEDKRIALTQIEQILIKHQWIEDIYIATLPEHTHLGAWVALSPSGIQAWRDTGRKYVIQTLKDCLKISIDNIAIPRHWRFTTQLPRNTQSKLQAIEVQQAFEALPTMITWQKHTTVPESSPLRCHENEHYFTTRIPLDLIYFSGHFERFPLVPGAVEIRWVIALAYENQLIPHDKISGVENLKFQHFLRPNDEAYLYLSFDSQRQKLHFHCHNQTSVCASGRIVLHE